MNKNKLWTVGAVSVMVAIVGGGWLLGIQPQLTMAANADRTRVGVEAQNSTNEALLVRLKRDYQGIDALRQQLDSLRVAIPADAQMSTFVKELNILASTHKVTVKSITVNDAKPFTLAGTPSNGAQKAPTNPKINPANFVVIPVQFSVTGTYAKVLDFVHDVQMGPRLFLVATLSSAASSNSPGVVALKKAVVSSPGTVDATIGGFVYVLLESGQK
ncbi:pilus assembly protein, PilO [mine drainage metagenome]|uniref:Pilus assembly protein, PilO n=1 Tax=mine drainage metagenome TaxID=410659 RepID=A0A1J5QUT3_9ZZZZ